jgi:hypothetical protein
MRGHDTNKAKQKINCVSGHLTDSTKVPLTQKGFFALKNQIFSQIFEILKEKRFSNEKTSNIEKLTGNISIIFVGLSVISQYIDMIELSPVFIFFCCFKGIQFFI